MTSKTEICKARYLLILEKNKELIAKKKKESGKHIPTNVSYKDGKFTFT